MLSQFSILVLLGSLCSSRLGYAQLQGCADSASPSSVTVQKTKISIVGVEFEGENPLQDALRAQLVEEIQHSDLPVSPEQPDSTWVNEALNPIGDALRSQGYFKNDVEGTPYLVRALATERLYGLRVAIEHGPQYRLRSLRFANISDKPLLFTDALLRQQFPLQEGELFDVSKIRDGLEAIGRLYGSKGYINATPEPDTTIDEKGSRIDLLIRVDEEQSYTIAKIEFQGLGSKGQNEPRAPQEIGDLFNPAVWQNFFKDNKLHLPPDSSPNRNMRVSRDNANGTVDITLDFRPCPKT